MNTMKLWIAFLCLCNLLFLSCNNDTIEPENNPEETPIWFEIQSDKTYIISEFIKGFIENQEATPVEKMILQQVQELLQQIKENN
ncbi:MAG: hypothetical protein Q4A54_12875, partial [Parabacteroides sp.]|nr:hypothetical protein [Parabacteroides sp.]